jgi:membrane protein implicated in regulation of membrane protease activity
MHRTGVTQVKKRQRRAEVLDRQIVICYTTTGGLRIRMGDNLWDARPPPDNLTPGPPGYYYN